MCVTCAKRRVLWRPTLSCRCPIMKLSCTYLDYHVSLVLHLLTQLAYAVLHIHLQSAILTQSHDLLYLYYTCMYQHLCRLTPYSTQGAVHSQSSRQPLLVFYTFLRTLTTPSCRCPKPTQTASYISLVFYMPSYFTTIFP